VPIDSVIVRALELSQMRELELRRSLGMQCSQKRRSRELELP